MSFKSFLTGKKGKNNETGKSGEDFACEYLQNLGYKIIERGYKTKFGEIDIVTKKGNILHFFEVKTSKSRHISPFENMTDKKLNMLRMNVEFYLLTNRIPENTMYFVSFIPVFLSINGEIVEIRIVENVL